MKNTIHAAIISVVVIASMALVVNAAHADCTIPVLTKKAQAKTVYLTNGNKLSVKQLEKFAGVCTVKTTLMTEAQVKALKIVELKAKLAKLTK